jgi:hypothetical protein
MNKKYGTMSFRLEHAGVEFYTEISGLSRAEIEEAMVKIASLLTCECCTPRFEEKNNGN